MLRISLLFSMLFYLFTSCSQTDSDSLQANAAQQDSSTAKEYQPTGMTIRERYNAPQGFQRVAADSGSFAYYLRHLPLKADGAEVSYYNGGKKSSYGVYKSVVDLPIGDKNLHQCADAVMRFRAEYLWRTGQANSIHFNFTNGFRVDYSEWLKGGRMVVSGNSTYWKAGNARANTYATFWSYMELIFNYAGTLSLSRELKQRNYQDLQIGDVFIKGGSPGHAVIVVDMVQHPETGEKRFLLAQSYMPAQETQILLTPGGKTSWYSIAGPGTVNTPEWTFTTDQLKHF